MVVNSKVYKQEACCGYLIIIVLVWMQEKSAVAGQLWIIIIWDVKSFISRSTISRHIVAVLKVLLDNSLKEHCLMWCHIFLLSIIIITYKYFCSDGKHIWHKSESTRGDNIKIDSMEIGWEGVGEVHVAQGREQWFRLLWVQ
jgi:hypothetical protein